MTEKFLECILRIRERIHHAEMFPVKNLTRIRMTYGEIRINCYFIKLHGTFIAKGYLVDKQTLIDKHF